MEQVRQLLGLGASVTAQHEQGRTILIAAAYQDNLSITDLGFHPEEFFGV